MAKIRDTEVDAYLFIKESLAAHGWSVKNPARHPEGDVYTQNECRNHSEIEQRLGLLTPENIVKVTESYYYVIEAKRSSRQLEQALAEAIEYAEKINESKVIKAVLVSGVAGNNAEGYRIKSQLLKEEAWVPITINQKEMTSLIPRDLAHELINTWNPVIEDVQIDEKLFLTTAERINAILHHGAINKNNRARVMAALLLSEVNETPVDLDTLPSVLIMDINTRVEAVLRHAGKAEIAAHIKITLPTSEDNHVKFKAAIVQTLTELRNLNIKSAMNSGTDVLGKFYEVFLKYGNGAKEIGIVLTPRHITKFAVEALDVKHSDVCLDPACGTGGFLVAAFDYVKKNCNPEQLEKFRLQNLFGVEQEAEVVALAIVNMIFRGDGKNNIVEGDCFQKHVIKNVRRDNGTAVLAQARPEGAGQVVARVLMNPPFNSSEKDYQFVERALSQMQDGGLLFTVLPYAAMCKSGEHSEWRRGLLEGHTLLSVITFPQYLFYPIPTITCGVCIKKGIPHPVEQNVLWVRALHDGFLKSKGKRLPNDREPNDFAAILNTVKAFLQNPALEVANVKQFQKACPIDFDDEMREYVPEYYLDQAPPTEEEIKNGIEQAVRDSVAFLIRAGREDG